MNRLAPSLSTTFLFLLTSLAYAQPTMSVTRIANGFSAPVFATTAPGDPNRMFVVEKNSGEIEIVDLNTGVRNATPFLTVANITNNGERGVLGLAFHPDYANNGKFYVHNSGSNGQTEIREYNRQSADVADPNSGTIVFTEPQPFSNHNGGWIGFGPGDDFPNDPNRNYAIPAGNPFSGQPGAAPEILHYGLRNPFRSSFDRETGDLYIGDVGQNAREEIDVAPAGSTGLNFGWRLREGTIATPSGGVGGNLPNAIDPIYDFINGNGDNQGSSVTGGYAYRGPIEALQGHYFFGDFINERVWSIKWDGSAPATFDGTNFRGFTDWTDILTTDNGSIGNIAAFGEDEEGGLYIVDFGGELFKIEAATFNDCDFVGPDGCDIDDIDGLFGQFGADMNGDGAIDGGDIAAWLQQASDVNNPAKASASDIYVLGDVDLNGSVDSTDLGLLLNNFADTNSLPWSAGNLNGDANVDSTDLGLMLNNFGFASATVAVPEPGFGTLQILMVLAFLITRTRFA